MRAYQHEEYGGPDVLRLQEVERPTPSSGEVVVRVEATSVNPLDAYGLRGEPLFARVGGGWRRPRSPRLGSDVAGTVADVGADVVGISVGSRVYGTATGAFAEHAVTKPAHIAPAPAEVDATSAAGLPVAGVTALQAIDASGVSAGGRVLVIGASGGVGTLVVQIAAARGARVTAVCSGRNLELVKSLGAEHAVDYTSGELDELAGPFDAIIDAAATPPFRRRRALLARTGTYVIVGAPAGNRLWGPLGAIVRAKLAVSLGGRRSRFVLASVDHDTLVELAALVDSGAIRPVIDRIVDFDSLPDAIRHLETRRARGKIVVEVACSRPEAAR